MPFTDTIQIAIRTARQKAPRHITELHILELLNVI